VSLFVDTSVWSLALRSANGLKKGIVLHRAERRWLHPRGGLRSIAAPQANGVVEFAGMPRYIASMSPAVKTILELMASWPAEDQEELSELAREIQARRTGVYRLSEEERAAIDAARHDPLAADDEVEAFWKRRGLA
jgi:hypothetical protein